MTADPRDRWPATPEGDLARVRAWNRGDPDAIAAAALDSADQAKRPTAMDDLIAFLRARLNEDEMAARAAAEAAQTSVWMDGAEGSVLGVGGDMHLRGAVLSIDDIGPHIARWDPARVLAEVEAKRRILDLHEPEPSGYQDGRYVYPAPGDLACSHCESLCHSSSGISCNGSPDAPWPCPTVRLIAAVCAEHPDYREEWRP